MILGWLFIPLPETERFSTLENGVPGTESPSAIFARENTSYTHLLANDEAVSEDVQLSLSLAHGRRSSRAGQLSFGESGKSLVHGSNNLSGRAMLVTFDFWLLFTLIDSNVSHY
jgi:hypothetical protein